MLNAQTPRPHPSSALENLRGGVLMLFAMAGFGFNDIIVKYLAHSLTLGQTIFIRGLFSILFLLIAAYFTGKLRPLLATLNWPTLVRALAEVLATLTFLLSLFNMPIANTTAILQALPLAVMLGAVIVFKEPIGWRRIVAIGIGFAGVLIIVRPGVEGFNIYSLAALGTVFFATIRDLVTRLISQQIPTLFIALVTAIFVTVMGALLSLTEPWTPVSMASLVGLAFAAGSLVIGYICIAASMRVGDIGFVVPFRYTILIYAIVAGIVLFDEIPDWQTLIGAAIIIVTGIYTFYRERNDSKME